MSGLAVVVVMAAALACSALPNTLWSIPDPRHSKDTQDHTDQSEANIGVGSIQERFVPNMDPEANIGAGSIQKRFVPNMDPEASIGAGSIQERFVPNMDPETNTGVGSIQERFVPNMDPKANIGVGSIQERFIPNMEPKMKVREHRTIPGDGEADSEKFWETFFSDREHVNMFRDFLAQKVTERGQKLDTERNAYDKAKSMSKYNNLEQIDSEINQRETDWTGTQSQLFHQERTEAKTNEVEKIVDDSNSLGNYPKLAEQLDENPQDQEARLESVSLFTDPIGNIYLPEAPPPGKNSEPSNNGRNHTGRSHKSGRSIKGMSDEQANHVKYLPNILQSQNWHELLGIKKSQMSPQIAKGQNSIRSGASKVPSQKTTDGRTKRNCPGCASTTIMCCNNAPKSNCAYQQQTGGPSRTPNVAPIITTTTTPVPTTTTPRPTTTPTSTEPPAVGVCLTLQYGCITNIQISLNPYHDLKNLTLAYQPNTTGITMSQDVASKVQEMTKDTKSNVFAGCAKYG